MTKEPQGKDQEAPNLNKKYTIPSKSIDGADIGTHGTSASSCHFAVESRSASSTIAQLDWYERHKWQVYEEDHMWVMLPLQGYGWVKMRI